jgi:hypothetical protein
MLESIRAKWFPLGEIGVESFGFRAEKGEDGKCDPKASDSRLDRVDDPLPRVCGRGGGS